MANATEIDRLLQAMLDDLGPAIEEITERTRREIPSFRGVPAAEHYADVEAAAEPLLRSRMSDGSGVGDPARLSDLGERRAQQGIPVEDTLRAFRIATDVFVGVARDTASRMGLDATRLMQLFQDALVATDDAMLLVSDAHRAQGLHSPKDPQAALRERFVIDALTGSVTPSELYRRAGAIGVNHEPSYRAFVVPDPGADTTSDLLGAIGLPGAAEARGLFAVHRQRVIGFIDGELDRSLVELVAFGPPRTLGSLRESFEIGARVAASATAFGLKGVQTMASAGLWVAVNEASEIGDAFISRYVDPVRSTQAAEEILATVREWFACGMRTQPTADRLHIHPNTLRYRLDRYTELCDCDLGVSEQAMAAWWAVQRDWSHSGGGSKRGTSAEPLVGGGEEVR